MTQAIPKLVTFEDFAAWRSEGGRYELYDGVIVEMAQPGGHHEDVVDFVARKLTVEFDRLSRTDFSSWRFTNVATTPLAVL